MAPRYQKLPPDSPTPSTSKLIPEEDYTLNENGDLVFTREYHLKRGYCCQSGCKHCPFGFTKIKSQTKAP